MGISEEFIKKVQAKKEAYYLSYKKVKKSGGYRWIDVPENELKQAQTTMLERLFYPYKKPNKIVHGFVKNKSAISNAATHVNCKKFLTMDIHDFFGSVTKSHLTQSVLKLIFKFCKCHNVDFNPKFLGEVLDLCLFYNTLPQGAPTSPYLANLAFKTCDDAI